MAAINDLIVRIQDPDLRQRIEKVGQGTVPCPTGTVPCPTLHKIKNSNIFIVEVGWGQLRHFISNKTYKEGDFILYKEKSLWDLEEENEDNKYYESRDAWLKDEPDEEPSFDSNEIEAICPFDDCEFLGNIRYDFHSPEFTKSNIVIARRDSFIYWEGYRTDEYISHGAMQSFDVISNSLLFLTYAERRYPSPDEKEWMKAYAYAKKKVEELDIPNLITDYNITCLFFHRGNCLL